MTAMHLALDQEGIPVLVHCVNTCFFDLIFKYWQVNQFIVLLLLDQPKIVCLSVWLPVLSQT